MADYQHCGFVGCAETGCGYGGMVRGEVTGTPGQTVTVVSEGTCAAGHKLATVATVTLPE